MNAGKVVLVATVNIRFCVARIINPLTCVNET